MYLRFITGEIDKRTGKMKGIFSLAYDLVDENNFQLLTRTRSKNCYLGSEIIYLSLNKFSKKKNDAHKNTHGISWMKPEAKEVIEKFWALKTHLEQAGHHIEIIKANNPGKVVYEDNMQLVAVPYGEEF